MSTAQKGNCCEEFFCTERQSDNHKARVTVPIRGPVILSGREQKKAQKSTKRVILNLRSTK